MGGHDKSLFIQSQEGKQSQSVQAFLHKSSYITSILEGPEAMSFVLF